SFLLEFVLFYLLDTSRTDIHPLSLHDALPISWFTAEQRSEPFSRKIYGFSSHSREAVSTRRVAVIFGQKRQHFLDHSGIKLCRRDRKSTRLNSSHLGISYAVFCLKKKI